MGGLCSRTRFLVTGSYGMEGVRAATAARTLYDARALPTFLPNVRETMFIRGVPSEPGFCWTERRLYGGREITLRKTITEFSETTLVDANGNEHISFKIGQTIEVVKDDVKCSLIPYFFGTFTLVIDETPTNCNDEPSRSCRLQWSYAFLSTNFYCSVMSSLCRKRLEKQFVGQVEQVLQSHYMEALRRTVKQLAAEKEPSFFDECQGMSC